MKKNLFAIFILAICLGISFVSRTTAQETNSNAALIAKNAPETRGYLLGIGDELEIKVLGEQQFDGQHTIDEDGKIQLPFVETPVIAVCRTDRELRAEITDLLKKYLRNPQVNLRILEKRSRPPAVVYGEVRNPQQFDMRRSVTLLELLSYTGGVTEQASGAIQVFHTQPVFCSDSGDFIKPQTKAANNDTNVPSEVYKLNDLRDGKTNSNPTVRPGDVVIVLKSPPIYVVGEVLAPKSYFIPENGLTLTEAVAMASGLTPQAKKKNIRIYRLKTGTNQREMLSYNLESIKKGAQENPVLQAYDIVEVEKAPKSIGQVLTEFVTGTVQNASTILPTRIVY